MPNVPGVRRDLAHRDGAGSQAVAPDDLDALVLQRTEQLARVNEALQQDVAERRSIESARSELLRRLVTAQEDERRRIARELHDQVGQLLAALVLGLKALERTAGAPAEVTQQIEQLQGLADEIGREIHELALDLRPTALDDLGLVAAVPHYVDLWSSRFHIDVDLHVSGLEGVRFSPAVETALYRTVQESLTNVAKHSQAGRVSIVLELRGNRLSLIVEDDGLGFDYEQLERLPPEHRRLGLYGMQDRLAAIGGSLDVESAPGKGTTVFARAPITSL